MCAESTDETTGHDLTRVKFAIARGIVVVLREPVARSSSTVATVPGTPLSSSSSVVNIPLVKIEGSSGNDDKDSGSHPESPAPISATTSVSSGRAFFSTDEDSTLLLKRSICRSIGARA